MKRTIDTHKRDKENQENEHPRNAGIAESEIDENEIDRVLADSFPASDAPPWTFGVTSALSTRIRTRKKR